VASGLAVRSPVRRFVRLRSRSGPIVPIESILRHTVEVEQRAMILRHLTGPLTRTESNSLDERTVERLYGLSTIHPEIELHDLRAVADALREFDTTY
jgi:hypothetical protein